MIRISWRRTLTRLGVAAAVILGAAGAHAAPTGPSISLAIDSPGSGYNSYSISGATTLDPNLPAGVPPTYSLSGVVTGSDPLYNTNFNCDWSITVNPDPSITSTFTLTNLSAVTQNFTMTVTLPIAALGPATVQGGYFGDADPLKGTKYTDTSGNGDVTLATFGGNPFYQALVNGIVSQGLGSFTLNANGGAGVYGVESQQQWGTPIPSAPFGPASGNIQIKWMFSVTGGDTVSSKGFFQVEQAAPEPTALVLMGAGLAALAVLRRRA